MQHTVDIAMLGVVAVNETPNNKNTKGHHAAAFDARCGMMRGTEAPPLLAMTAFEIAIFLFDDRAEERPLLLASTTSAHAHRSHVNMLCHRKPNRRKKFTDTDRQNMFR